MWKQNQTYINHVANPPDVDTLSIIRYLEAIVWNHNNNKRAVVAENRCDDVKGCVSTYNIIPLMFVVTRHRKRHARLIFVVFRKAYCLVYPLVPSVGRRNYKCCKQDVNQDWGTWISREDVEQLASQPLDWGFGCGQHCEKDGFCSEVRAMPKHQAAKIWELDDCEVSKGWCLIAFLPHDAHSNMCLLYHVHVISTISDCQSYSFWIHLPHTLDKVRLLWWWSSIDD